MVWCRQEVPGEFSSFSVNHSPEFLGDGGSPRRWQRAPSFLAMQTLLMWPFGVKLTSPEGAQGLGGRPFYFWWARPGKRSVSQERGRVPASSAPSAGAGCQLRLPQPGGGARAQPCAEWCPQPPQPHEGGMVSPIFQVRTLRLIEVFLAHLNSFGLKGEKPRVLSLLSARTGGGRS